MKSKILKVDFGSLKFTDALKFTPSEEEELSDILYKSFSLGLKGTVEYQPDGYMTMPPFYNTILIYKANKLVSKSMMTAKLPRLH